MAIAVVAGAVANKCGNGGNAWAVMNWVLGLRSLGFDVYLLEQISRANCLSEDEHDSDFELSGNVAYFDLVARHFGLSGSAALIYENGEKIHGLTAPELADLAAAADLLFNISGHLVLPSFLESGAIKLYLDFDPGYTQFWHASGNSGARLEGHDFFFTIGENIGKDNCGIPTGDIDWRITRQPVALDYWPVAPPARPGRFTTVASWRGAYGPVKFRGESYGQKVHEFRKFVLLPERASYEFEIALDIEPGDSSDLNLLHRHSWKIVDPLCVAADAYDFRRYVQDSAAEFSVAQGIYVETYSGWFSDRTVRYLASGKPALVQDTGFSCNYPTGEGLVAFRTLEEATRGAIAIMENYDQHARSARALAEDRFDCHRVISAMLSKVGL